MSQADVQSPPPQHEQQFDLGNAGPGAQGGQAQGDDRNDHEKEVDKQLALRLAAIIEDANSKTGPLCKMIRKVKHFHFYLSMAHDK